MASKVTVFTLVSALCVCNILFYVLYLSPTVQMTYDSESVTSRSHHNQSPCNSNLVLLQHVIGVANSALRGGDVTTTKSTAAAAENTVKPAENATTAEDVNSTSTLNASLLIVESDAITNVPKLGDGTQVVLTDYRTHQTTTVAQTTYVSTNISITTSVITTTTTTTTPKPTTTKVLSAGSTATKTTLEYHPYSYILNEQGLCSQPEEVLLVILVCSGLDHFAARTAIRETWGTVVKERSDVKLAFVMGKTENETLQKSLVQEAYNYSDMIQEDFLDTYNNLTLKSVMLLKWVDTFCSNAKYVMKVDDDMFLNLNNLLRYLVTVKNKPKMLFGRLVKGARAIRDKKSKWYVPESEYKAKIYPDYLSGTGYVMSSDVVRTLYATAQKTPMIHLEDVYVTGIVARKSGIPRKYHSGFTYEKRPVKGCAFKGTVTGHKVTPKEIRLIWKELSDKNLKCTVAKG